MHLSDPDFCESRCPVCTKARAGNRFPEATNAMHCWNCRKEIPAGAGSCPYFDCGAAYCHACGAVLANEEE
jgi:hypothetical protein